MLSSTSPDVSPEEVAGALDFSVPWHAHAEVGLEKASTAEGVPAWVHGLTALMLLFVEVRKGSDADGGDRPVPAEEHA
jgi:hypothetical protein